MSPTDPTLGYFLTPVDLDGDEDFASLLPEQQAIWWYVMRRCCRSWKPWVHQGHAVPLWSFVTSLAAIATALHIDRPGSSATKNRVARCLGRLESFGWIRRSPLKRAADTGVEVADTGVEVRGQAGFVLSLVRSERWQAVDTYRRTVGGHQRNTGNSPPVDKLSSSSDLKIRSSSSLRSEKDREEDARDPSQLRLEPTPEAEASDSKLSGDGWAVVRRMIDYRRARNKPIHRSTQHQYAGHLKRALADTEGLTVDRIAVALGKLERCWAEMNAYKPVEAWGLGQLIANVDWIEAWGEGRTHKPNGKLDPRVHVATAAEWAEADTEW